MPSVSSLNACASRGRAGAGRALYELGHLVAAQAADPQPHRGVGAAQVGQCLGERRGDVGVGVAEGGEHEQARVAGRAGEVAQEQERRRVRPVDVLEDQQHGPVEAGEHVGDRGVQPVALGVRVRRRGLRQVVELGPQLGQQPRQLAAGAADGGAQLGRVKRADELLERLDERAVRRAHVGVAAAVEHERALGGGLGGELAHEPALAGPRLAAEQDDAAAGVFGPRHQLAQRRQLRRASDERERRREAKGAGRRSVEHDQT